MDVSTGCPGNTTGLEVTFEHLNDARDLELELNVECSVSRPGLVGRVYAAGSGGPWYTIQINDYPSTDALLFGFPSWPDADNRYSTRRTFHIPASAVPTDKGAVWIAVFDPSTGQQPFDTKFDLVQVFWDYNVHGSTLSGAVIPPSGLINFQLPTSPLVVGGGMGGG